MTTTIILMTIQSMMIGNAISPCVLSTTLEFGSGSGLYFEIMANPDGVSLLSRSAM
jgi:hypothetical protein